MTMCIAIRAKDGIILASDGKVTRASISFRTVARIWQKTNKIHSIPPHVLVAGAGELAMIHSVVDALADAEEDVRAQGVDGLAPLARDTLAGLRSEANARYRAIYGDEGTMHAPKAYFLLVQSTPEPRLVYVSEDGDIEDQTHLGYAVTGSGDLIIHVRMQPYDPAELTMDQAAVLAYGLIKDTIDSGTFRVSDPVQLWSLDGTGPPDEWDPGRIDKTAERYHAFRREMLDVLRSY